MNATKLARKCAIASLFVPVASALLATAAWAIQGGFGGGHGGLDPLIGCLGLPSILLLEGAPLPEFVHHSDLLLIIWVPAIVNEVILWGPLALLLFWLASERSD